MGEPESQPVAWRDAVAGALGPLGATDHDTVMAKVDEAVSKVARARRPAEVISSVARVVAIAIIVLAGVGSVVLAWLWSDGAPIWLKIAAVLLTLLILLLAFAIYGSFDNLGPVGKRIIYALAWALWLVVAFVPERTSWAPGWLREGWLHAALAASAVSYVSVWVVGVFMVRFPNGLVYSGFTRSIRRRLPEESLIDGLTDFFVNVPAPGTVDTIAVRRDTLKQLEKLALDFEQWWPHRVRTGFPVVDGKAQDWARKIGTHVRSEQLGLLTGQRNRADLSPSLGKIIADLILRNDPGPNEDVDMAIERITWWLRFRRVLTATLLLLIGVAVLITAAWQPGLPVVLQEHGWSNLGTALTWSDELRAGALAGAFTILSLFARLVSPETSTANPTPFPRLRIRR